MVAVPNEFFGGSVAVAGLLTGQDIQRHLAAQGDLGDAVLVPAVALRDGEGVFLDDLTPADLVASARRARGTGRARATRAPAGARVTA